MNSARPPLRKVLAISVLATALVGCAYQREMSKLESEREVLQYRLTEENRQRQIAEQTSHTLAAERNALKWEISADQRKLGQLQVEKRQAQAKARQGSTRDEEELRRLERETSRMEEVVNEKKRRYEALLKVF